MKHIIKTSMLAIVVAVIGIAQHPQIWKELGGEPFFEELQTKLDVFYEKQNPELTYIQTDRTLYDPGDYIEFSAYVRNQSDLKHSNTSDFVTAELIRPNGSVHSTTRVSCIDGSGSGKFSLGREVEGGIWKIRCKTRWGNNFGDVYTKEINVQRVVLPRLLMKLDFAEKSYSAGSTVKALLALNELNQKPLAQHEFDYVVSIDGNEVSRSKGSTDTDGKASVKFNLPKELNSNDGLVNIMINYQGQSESISRSVPIVLGNIDVQLMPEGGDMVANQSSRVAFKAVDEWGNPAEIKGVIKDGSGKVVSKFASFHAGMGAFDLKASSTERYIMEITEPTGVKDKYALPMAVAKLGLRVDKEGKDKLRIQIQKATAEDVKLVVRQGSKLLVKQSFKDENTEPIIFETSTENFAMGIAEVVLFDSKNNIKATRKVFVNEDRSLQVSLKTNKSQYAPREEVELTAEVRDSKGTPVQGNFSLAVVDDKNIRMADDRQPNIMGQSLLCGQLVGEVYEPNYYFSRPNESEYTDDGKDHSKALDYLMLTQGWKRFKWADVTSGNTQALSYKAEKANVSGYVYDMSRQGIKGIKVSIPDLGLNTTTDKNGKYTFSKAMITPSTRVVLVDEEKRFGANTYQQASYDTDVNFYETLSMHGQVIDAKTNEPLPGAVIYAYTEGYRMYLGATSSDMDGNFKLDISPQYMQYMTGNDLLYCNYAGYTIATQNINFKNAKEKITLKIEQQETQLESVVVTTNKNHHRKLNKPSSTKASKKEKANKVVPMAAPGRHKDVAEQEESKVEALDDAAMPMVEDAPMVQLAAPVMADMNATLTSGGAVQLTAPVGNTFDGATNAVTTTVVTDPNNTQYKPVVIEPKETKALTRSDFRKTIYWNPKLHLNEQGRASMKFTLSDDNSQFRVTMEGFSEDGAVAHAEATIFTQMQFQMAAKMPTAVLTEDELQIPIIFTNNTGSAINGAYLAAFDERYLQPVNGKSAANGISMPLTLAPNSSQTVFLSYKATSLAAGMDIPFQVNFTGGGLADKFVQNLRVEPRGFPVHETFTGTEKQKSFEVFIKKPQEGSIKCRLVAHPNALDEVMSGLASLLHYPSGCFEQTSSSNYPNVMVLDYMRATKTSNPSLEDQCKGMLNAGYGMLKGYESPGGGFYWWANSPMHETLTAYGIMEFKDMSNVYNVDQAIIERAVKALFNKRDNAGGWIDSGNALHTWVGASDIRSAYITWAMCEAGMGKELSKEINALKGSKDPYVLALTANCLAIMQDPSLSSVMDELLVAQDKDGSWTGTRHSVTASTGHALKIETTALAVLAILKSGKGLSAVPKAIKVLQEGRTHFGYGNTQATVLALKALLENAKKNQHAPENGNLSVYINGAKINSVRFTTDTKGDIVIEGIEKYLAEGKQNIEVRFDGCKEGMPFELELDYTSREPNSQEACKVDINTTLSKSSCKMGETVRYNVSVKNKTSEMLPSTMAMVGIPAGLSPQAWQLRELMDKKVCDYYEIFNGFVVFHFVSMPPSEVREIALDLKADIPGTYEAPASSAFLYYTNELKDWNSPQSISIASK